jgi:hypothetical protein
MFNVERSIVFNFTHVSEEYDFMQGDDFEWVECTQVEGTDCYCDTEAEKRLNGLMADQPLETVHWLDSGDYHYLSKLWTDRILEPFTLVVLDHHPDMQRPMFGELLSCGSWVRAALEQNPQLRQVWLIGMDDKLVGETQGFGDKLKMVTESQLRTTPLDQLLQEFVMEAPLYLSIDKDVMTPNECSTNWDQGTMSWKQLTALLEALMQNRVIGIDICGEEPKILTECCYRPDGNINAKFNDSLHNIIKEICSTK